MAEPRRSEFRSPYRDFWTVEHNSRFETDRELSYAVNENTFTVKKGYPNPEVNDWKVYNREGVQIGVPEIIKDNKGPILRITRRQ
jgi:hypothetical protein